MENVNYSLDQITGILTQQLQLLRNMKESNDTYSQSVPFFGTSFNPFSPTQNTLNPFNAGLANATGATGNIMNAFGLPTAAQMGIGFGVNMFQRKIGGTDVSTLGTVPPATGFGFFQNTSKINYEQRMMAAAHMGDKLSTGALNLIGTGLSVFGSWPGMIAGAGFTIAADQAKQQNAYNKYLLQNSYRFINYGESANTRGMGGFNLNERMEAATFLRHFGTENLISDADTQKLLRSFTEGELLRNTKDLKSFKENMEKLTKAVKEGALALGETYESMAGLMAEMKKLGMDPTKVNSYAAGAKAIQGLTGLNGSDVLSNVMGFAGVFAQGTGMGTANLYENFQSKLLYTNAMYDDVYEKAMSGDQSAQRTLSLIQNFGGVEGAYKSMASFEQQLFNEQTALSTMGTLFFDYNEDGTFSFNEAAFNKYMSGDKDGLLKKAQSKLQSRSVEAQSAWISQGQEYIMGNLNNSQMQQFIKAYLDMLQAKSHLAGKDMTTKEQLRTLLGYSGGDAELYANLQDYMGADGGALERNYTNLKRKQEIIDKANANAVGAGYGLKRYWEGAKDFLGDYTTPFVAAGNAIGQFVQDARNGYQYNISDTSSKHGADSVEESVKIVEKALDDLGKSIEGLGGSANAEKDKLKGLGAAIKEEKDKIYSIDSNYISGESLYDLSLSAREGGYKKTAGMISGGLTATLGIVTGFFNPALGIGIAGAGAAHFAKSYHGDDGGRITDEERAVYNDSLRSYLDLDESVSDDKMIIQAAQEANKLAGLSDADWAKMSKEDALSKKQFIASFANMYGDYMSAEGRKAASNMAESIEKEAEAMSSEAAYSRDELEQKIKNVDSQIKEKKKKMAEASAKGDTAAANKYADELEKLRTDKSNYSIIYDETESRINQNNVAIEAMGAAMGWSEDKIKMFLLDEKKMGDYSYENSIEQQKMVTASVAADMTSLINTGTLKSSAKGREYATAGIDLDALMNGEIDVNDAAAQVVSSYVDGVSSSMTDEESEDFADSIKESAKEAKTLEKRFSALNDLLPTLTTNASNAADALGSIKND